MTTTGSGFKRLMASAAIAACALAMLPAQTRAAGAPDLVVSSLTGVPASALIGKSFKVDVTVRNSGHRAAKASTTAVYLGWDPKLEFGKAGKLGRLKIPGLGKGKAHKGVVKLKAPPDAAVGEPLYVVACADDAKKVHESNEGNNCKAAKKPLQFRGTPTVYELIDKEVASGDIDHATGLLYYAYAAAGDPRLPKRFSTPAASFDSPEALRTIADGFGGLSAADQQKLDPFFSPPSYAGAYLPPGSGKASRHRARGAALRTNPPGSCIPGDLERPDAVGWDSIATTHFRIWYYTAAAQGLPDGAASPAQSQAAAATLAGIAEYVYSQETAIWRAPLSDAATPCNGGDGLIDVYAVRLSDRAKAQAVPHPPGSNLRPGWIWAAPEAINSDAKARSYFAHEFAHLTQLAYNESANPPGWGTRIEYGWLEEASATWAMDKVYPADNLEHEFADSYFKGSAWGTPLGECERYACGNGYRDYLFFFFLTHKLGSPAVMSSIWSNVESKDSIGAVKQAIGGSFGTQWRDFALYDMNRENYRQYKTWDGITNQLPLAKDGPTFKVELQGKQKRTSPYPYAQAGGTGLSAKTFAWVNFEFPDAKARLITLNDFGYQGGVDGDTKVTAWYKLANGATGITDLSGQSEHTWCRDIPGENLTQLVVFYTHGRPAPYLNQTDRLQFPKPTAKVIAARRCQNLPYTGTVSGTASYDSSVLGPGNNVEANWSGTVRLIPIDTGNKGYPAYYQVDPSQGGSILYNVSGHLGGCDIAGSESIDLSALAMEQGAVLNINDTDPVTYGLNIYMGYYMDVTVTQSNCDDPNNNGPNHHWYPSIGVPSIARSAPDAVLGEDGLVSGSGSNNNGTGSPDQTWQWHLTPSS